MSTNVGTQTGPVRTVRSLEHEAALELTRTADVLHQEVTELLRSADLTPTQFNVLRILRGAGEAGLTAGEVGERMLTRACDVTRLLDRLEAQGLLSRTRSLPDRRVVTVTITGAGLELLSRLDGPMSRLHLHQLQHLGPDRLGQLIELLRAARQR